MVMRSTEDRCRVVVLAIGVWCLAPAWVNAALTNAPVVTSFTINGGGASTTSSTVTLNNAYSSEYRPPLEYIASESADFTGASWQTYSAAPSFVLSSGYGTKTVYFKLRNRQGESTSASDTIVRTFRYLQFANREWLVRNSGWAWDGTRWCYGYSDAGEGDEKNVFLDEQGRLHLRVTQHADGYWYGAVLDTAKPTRCGVHRFYVDSPVGSLNKNLDAAPHLARYVVPTSRHPNLQELDIEFYWTPAFGTNANYFVHGLWSDSQNRYVADLDRRFQIDSVLASSTHYIDWHNRTDTQYAYFKSFQGHAVEPDSAHPLIAESWYTGTCIPPQEGEYNMNVTLCAVFLRDINNPSKHPEPADEDRNGVPDGTLEFIIAGADLPAANTSLNVGFTRTGQPASLTVAANSAATFTVGATTSGQGPLTYQWLKDGIALSETDQHYYNSGSTTVTTATLRISSTVPEDAGTYRCRVTDRSAGAYTLSDSVISNAADLTVTAGGGGKPGKPTKP